MKHLAVFIHAPIFPVDVGAGSALRDVVAFTGGAALASPTAGEALAVVAEVFVVSGHHTQSDRVLSLWSKLHGQQRHQFVFGGGDG
jgi:hypothetical protein